ncbi:hypothetical protein FRC11_012315, partial [Ceratobasidium sp. 423]
ELIIASELLKSSIYRYINACSATTEAYRTLNNLGRDSRAVLDCITRELQAAAGYETDVKRAKSTLSQCRNSARTIVSINTLPSEILARIFELIHSPRTCSPRNQTNGLNIEESAELARPMISVVLSHVCTRWREIALGSQILWSRIAVVTSDLQDPLFEKLLDRSKVLAVRAGSLGTSLRIYVTRDIIPDTLSNAARLGHLCSGSEQTLRGLHLYNWASKDDFCDVLRECLPCLVPGTLKQLILVDHPAERASRAANIFDDPAAKSMDQYLRSLSVLHLINVGLPRSSLAYPGLSDLRLIVNRIYDNFSISIPQLTAILSSSPKLRIFHFGYMLDSEGWTSNGPIRVPLEELEELNIRGMVGSPESLLQLLLPGSKPMSLSISADCNTNLLNHTIQDPIPNSVLKFLERSNVVELHIDCGIATETIPLPSLRKEPLTRLRVLGLKDFILNEHIDPTGPGKPWFNQLDLLHLHDCTIDPEVLQEFLGVCAARELKACGCTLTNDQEVITLAEVVPNIMISDLPDPPLVADWECWEIPRAYI